MENFLKKRQKKSLYYCSCKGGNFGDELNKVLFERLFLADLNYCTNVWKADYIGIGSVLGWSCVNPIGDKAKFLYPIKRFLGKKGKLTVLGSGFIEAPNNNLKFVRKMDFKVIRGKLTKDFLQKKGYINTSPVLGDPGLLASYLYKTNNKKYKLGIIPHLNDMDSPSIFDIYKKYKSVSVLINVHDDPLCVISQIASCENIISSSLHGLIIADSFGIPNIWVENKFNHGYDKNNSFKFNDYYSIYGISNIAPIQTLEFPDHDLEIIKKNYMVDFVMVKKIQEELYSFFVDFFRK